MIPRPNVRPEATHRFGLMTTEDARFFEELLRSIVSGFGAVSMLEIGVHSGDTTLGTYEYVMALGASFTWTGVDRDCQAHQPFPNGFNFICGDSKNAFVKICDVFNLLYIDGNHDRNHAMLDWLNYSQFLVNGGYAVFHDTSVDVQGMHNQGDGPPDHPLFSISTRSAMELLGLLNNERYGWSMLAEQPAPWGMCVFKKGERCTSTT